jgi:ABC-type antimicrobial peptide transport system permease subunit
LAVNWPILYLLGQSIKINRISFRVIGVMESKGGTGFGSLDDAIYVPLTTAQRRLFGKKMTTIAIQAADEHGV